MLAKGAGMSDVYLLKSSENSTPSCRTPNLVCLVLEVDGLSPVKARCNDVVDCVYYRLCGVFGCETMLV